MPSAQRRVGGPSAHSKSMMHGKPWSLTRIVSGRSARNTICCCDAMRFAQPTPRPAARWQMRPRSPVQMWTAVGGPERAYLVDAVEERDEVRDVDAREALVQLKLRALSAVCCLPHVVCCTLSAARRLPLSLANSSKGRGEAHCRAARGREYFGHSLRTHPRMAHPEDCVCASPGADVTRLPALTRACNDRANGPMSTNAPLRRAHGAHPPAGR